MDINKNIKKLFSLTSKSDDEFIKFINKKFGGINYQSDGNSLLHLLVVQDNYRLDLVLKGIKKLITLGIDSNTKDSLGRTFLQRSLDTYGLDLIIQILRDKDFFTKYIDANSVDNEGNTLVHSAILKWNNYFEYDEIIELFDILIDYYNFDVSKRNNNNDSILDLATERIDVSHKISLDSIARIYYRYNNDEFSKLILDSNKDDLINSLNLKFIVYSVSLLICQTTNPKNDEVVDRTLLCIKKLLSIGCNPVIEIDGNNFITDAIFKGYPISYILQIIELMASIGCLDTDFSKSFVLAMMEENRPLKDIIDIYVIASKYGYDNLRQDIRILQSRRSLFDFLNDGVRRSELYDKIRLDGFRIMFNDALRNFGISNEVLLSDDILKTLTDTTKNFRKFLKLGNEYQFIQSFCNFMKEKYSMNIIFNETISEKDILTDLKEYLISLFEDKVNRTLVLTKGSEKNE
ncbi:MAG: hypothetical protein V8Q75_02775 [Bacilli bacterium]